MRSPLLAAPAVLLLAVSSAGCRSASARIQGVETPNPGATELLVRVSANKLWKVQDECKVVAEFAGHVGTAPLVLTPEGPQPELISPVISAWTKGEPSSADRVLVKVMFRNKQLAHAQFPPPWDPALFDGAPARTPDRQPTASQADLRTPDAAAPAKRQPAGGSSSTDLRRPDAGSPDARTGSTTSTNPLAPNASLTPCGTCGEPRGSQTPCPHCGIR